MGIWERDPRVFFYKNTFGGELELVNFFGGTSIPNKKKKMVKGSMGLFFCSFLHSKKKKLNRHLLPLPSNGKLPKKAALSGDLQSLYFVVSFIQKKKI